MTTPTSRLPTACRTRPVRLRTADWSQTKRRPLGVGVRGALLRPFGTGGRGMSHRPGPGPEGVVRPPKQGGRPAELIPPGRSMMGLIRAPGLKSRSPPTRPSPVSDRFLDRRGNRSGAETPLSSSSSRSGLPVRVPRPHPRAAHHPLPRLAPHSWHGLPSLVRINAGVASGGAFTPPLRSTGRSRWLSSSRARNPPQEGSPTYFSSPSHAQLDPQADLRERHLSTSLCTEFVDNDGGAVPGAPPVRPPRVARVNAA